ncbi:hypothetical protein GCM10025876_31210 [Demequina litorisediminis]|uniref:Uncharacterized protein n=1 Tax=Demequina litorisediminis TaxID=1849022 RepID=A0ABQ6IIC9_9MICO|nr:hypothetical protein GCM10025876_31210 [Demequina litorisediminis]
MKAAAPGRFSARASSGIAASTSSSVSAVALGEGVAEGEGLTDGSTAATDEDGDGVDVTIGSASPVHPPSSKTATHMPPAIVPIRRILPPLLAPMPCDPTDAPPDSPGECRFCG